jgi:S-DNA-T family DNA segregation ATPase FtsK/SpoIIIE
MARRKEGRSRDGSAGARSGGWRFVRYCLVLALAGMVGLAWVSLLSFSRADPPSHDVYPHIGPVHNAAGIMGAHLAYFLRYWLGGGVYMGLLFATVAALSLVLGGVISDGLWRVIGATLLVAATSTAVYLLKHDTGGILDWGVLGGAAGRFLLDRFAWAGWIIVIICLCISLMLTAENLVLKLPAVGRHLWSRRGELPAVVDGIKEAAGKFGSLLPARQEEDPKVVLRAPKQDGPAKGDRPSTAKAAPVPKATSKALLAPLPDKAASRAPSSLAPKAANPAPARPVVSQGQWQLPAMSMLSEPAGGYLASQEEQALVKRDVLQQTLVNFNIEARVVGYTTGPVITMFEIDLAPGVKVAQVNNLTNDIARALAVPGVRVVSPLPGRDTIGIEVPNVQKEIVRLKELMLTDPEAATRMYLPLYLGKDAGGAAIVSDLASMPHMLIAGTTGSGKSVCINAIVTSLLMTRSPRQVRLVLVDPKMVEMAAFENLPHLLCPIINDMRRAEEILEWTATKMDERYELLKEAGVKNIAGYNRLGPEELYLRFGAASDEERKAIPTWMPYYVVIVDELADLIMTSSKEVETHIIRIAQKARAVGIHMILATQRPSANVVTGLIRSNMPCRISFRVATRIESRIVLDQNGAEVLLGQGDMLFLQPGTSNLIRAQGTYIDDSEIRAVTGELRARGQPQYDTELSRLNSRLGEEGAGERDEMFDQAVEIVLASQRGSVSLLQRRLQVGYSRASRIIDQMAEAGLLGEFKGSQARECMLSLEDWRAMKTSIAADQSGQSALNGQPTSS